MENKFNIGDKVDFVNDYGVIFKDKVITDVKLINGEFRYQIEPNDTPWFLIYEKNLYLAGTYKEPNINIELNNGTIAKFLGYDDWNNKVYCIVIGNKSFNAVLLHEKTLYSISDYEEPSPLKYQLQPRKASGKEQ
jgi:hypothetical protein